MRGGSSAFSPSHGSRTYTVTESQPRESQPGPSGAVEGSEDERSVDAVGRAVGRLVLRGGPRSQPRVVWREDVVDNEGMGKKKTKSALC